MSKQAPATFAFRKNMRSHGKPWLALGVSTVLFACAPNDPGDTATQGSGGSLELTGGMTSLASGGTTHTPTGGSDGGNGLGASGGRSASGGSADGASSGGGLLPAGGGPGTGGAPVIHVECEDHDVQLQVDALATTAVAELGRPFSTDQEDLVGPEDWDTQYGKSPEIIAHSSGDDLDILFQDQDSEEFAYVVHLSATTTGYGIDRAYRVESLGRIMGFTKDSAGNYYVATCIDEDDRVSSTYPPSNLHRSGIVRIVKFDEKGCVLMESDVDQQRGIHNAESEIIVNPMVASTARLVWGGERLLLLHGHNTEPASDLNGARHQKAIATHIDANTGSVTRASTMWVSHSFDQRAIYDGRGFVELHLGDAYPRSITMGRYGDEAGSGGYFAYAIKGEEGQNNTYTRLGTLLPSDDPSFGYLVLFATERTSDAGGDKLVEGTRDVALVRVLREFAAQDEKEIIVEMGPDVATQDVVSSERDITNHVRWLTQLQEGNHAERPRMAALANGNLIVLFEKYSQNEFMGTFALGLDSTGKVSDGPVEIPGRHHISRGDDIVALGNRALYVTGGEGALHLNWVLADLSATRTTLY